MTTYEDSFGSAGERLLQEALGTGERASGFYERQMRPCLTPAMMDFIARQYMVFLSTADAHGECDASFRSGPPGFVVALDDHTLTYPEYRGNGVVASAGNITENPHLGMLFIDFTEHHIGLHVNGRAQVLSAHDHYALYPHLPRDTAPGRQPQMWIHLSVDEAYVHCSKHIPHLEPAPRQRTSPAQRPKDSEYFTGERRPVAYPTPPSYPGGYAEPSSYPAAPPPPAAPPAPARHAAGSGNAPGAPARTRRERLLKLLR
ncbi:pyridoxamine 5'-phosphate oxidase family protein [Streptomyces sp. NPDC059398]|uniref:pyridoxamine 5'-phosphate oxidase family protein n=1 Tax=Streptomyces sp. NPDC059398 TaxID=3346820 RepID=UPI0036B2C5FB